MTMRFILMHKTNARWEAGATPSPELIARVGRMIADMSRAGVLLAGEGLRASSQGVRLVFTGGERSVTKGPFRGANELIAAFAILRTASIDEAVHWASRFAAIIGDVEIDIRPVTEPWDLGMAPKPPDLTTRRYMVMQKADRRTEAGVPPASGTAAALSALIAETTKSGVLLVFEQLAPSAQGVRFRFFGGETSMTDGPFTESKEMIAGFVIIRASSVHEAVEWAPRYAAAVGDIELDVRALVDPASPPSR